MPLVLLTLLHATPAVRVGTQGMWRAVRATAPARSQLFSPACRAASGTSGDGADSDNIASNTNQFKPGGNMFANPLPAPSGKRVDEIVEFPTRLQFKIVGLADPNFVADMERICAETCGKPVTASSTRDKGKYRSITMDLDIQSADAFYRIYETVGKDPRVKFMI
jgi:putative lipoic acid-binding regulatory protein